MITDEIGSGILPAIITVSPNSEINGILIFPKDVRVLTANIKRTAYHIDVH